MKKVCIMYLDKEIREREPPLAKRILFVNENTTKTISGVIDYFIKENDASIAKLGYIENIRRIGIIIPRQGTEIGYDPSKIGPSVIVTFDKTKGNNKNLRIYENEWGGDYRLEEVIKYTIKEGRFFKSETMPKEFVKYLH